MLRSTVGKASLSAPPPEAATDGFVCMSCHVLMPEVAMKPQTLTSRELRWYRWYRWYCRHIMLIMVVLIGGTGGTTMKTKLANTGPTDWYHLCSIKSRGVPPVPPVPPKN